MIGQFKGRQKTNVYGSVSDLAVARSGFNQIAYFIYGSIPYLVCRYILDPGESPNVSRSL